MNEKYNYNFCKYAHGKKLYDFDRCYNNCNKTCPSVSNIFYGKIIKIPVIKQICSICRNINSSIQTRKYEKDYISEYETTTVKFIWGIKSYADLCDHDVCLESMNDIDLIYLKDENKYILGIETYLGFDNEEDKIKYTKWLLDEFTKYMEKNNLDTTRKVSWYYLFDGVSINNHFESIEECYAMFKLLVNGYCG